MDLAQCDVRLDNRALKGRSFLLGNKRAFSLSLPAAAGSSEVLLHPHKWFGAYHYGHKFLEAQVVRAGQSGRVLLSGRVQTGFTMGITSARREYEVDGVRYVEEYFVPDGVQGIAVLLEGDTEFTVEPQFDIRYAAALRHDCDDYDVEEVTDGAVVSAAMPSGRYDDATESFVPDGEEKEEVRLWAAVQVIGTGASSQILPPAHRTRRKLFPKDHYRRRLVSQAGDDAADHAPLWNQSTSRVWAPVRLHLPGTGAVVYGFGSSREEALQALSALRDNLTAFRAQKSDGARDILEHAVLETGVEQVDRAYAQVLSRLMDALVARSAVIGDTALERPATMILAGNQYFHDSWKRDENIALGFLLTLGLYDLARDVIRDTWQLQDDRTGRLPQRIRVGEDPPYHSSDGTLWALLRLHQYRLYSGDESLLQEKLPMVRLFFERSLERTVDGMLPSGRTTDPDYLWETWMDTHHTPRHGFPVEIQMLWIAALRSFRPVFEARHPDLHARMEAAEVAAWQALQRFNVRGLPADSLDENLVVRDLITPNAYFCFGLGLDLGPQIEKTMREMGRKHLAGSHGIRTLAPMDWQQVFSPQFLADRRHVRGLRMRSIGKYNYHRGVEWNWLSRFFAQADLKYGDADLAYRTYLRAQVRSVLMRSGIGGISELHDLSGARGPDFQSWSMSGFLEGLHAFAGVSIDVPERRIVAAPQLPSSWPRLQVRKWYGRIPFDVSLERHESEQVFRLTAPWGQAPDATVEVALVLPERSRARHIEARTEGVPYVPSFRLEPIEGTTRSRVHVELPLSQTVELRVLTTARSSVPLTA